MNATILVVEDNPANFRLVTETLGYRGYRTIAADSAEAALTLLATTAPQLILLDLALPRMDGLTLARELKSNPRTRTIPLVALTAYAMREDEQRARAAGCDGYLTKPIDTRTFADQLETFMPRAKPSPEMPP